LAAAGSASALQVSATTTISSTISFTRVADGRLTTAAAPPTGLAAAAGDCGASAVTSPSSAGCVSGSACAASPASSSGTSAEMY